MNIRLLSRFSLFKGCSSTPRKCFSYLVGNSRLEIVNSRSLFSWPNNNNNRNSVYLSNHFSLIDSTGTLIQKRYKKKLSSKKSSHRKEADEVKEQEEEDEADEDEPVEGEDTKLVHTTVPSLRLDMISKTCFGLSRAKIDEHFYSGLIRLNGYRVSKKSHEIAQDDTIDLIRGFNEDNRALVDVNRVEVIMVDDKAASSGRIRITYRKVNKLTVDNFKEDPYESQWN